MTPKTRDVLVISETGYFPLAKTLWMNSMPACDFASIRIIDVLRTNVAISGH
jgi:hypothetical protein